LEKWLTARFEFVIEREIAKEPAPPITGKLSSRSYLEYENHT